MVLRRFFYGAVTVFCVLLGGPAHGQSGPIEQLRLIQTQTTFTRTDGALVRFVPDDDGSDRSVAAASSSASPTQDDIKPCLTRTYSDWSGWDICNIEDRLLASTDFGMGHVIRLDGVTSRYQVNWQTSGVNLSSTYTFDDRCPEGWYLDYGGPLAGDEVCWSPGTIYLAWYYPAHPPGEYTFYRSAGGVAFPTDTASVLPGTLHAENGNGQSTLINEVALASLEVGLRDFRGNRVRFPIHPYDDHRNSFTFTVTGPHRSVGASVTPSAVAPDVIGTGKVKFRAGDKPGNYYVDVASEDAEPLPSAFTIAAVERLEPEDNLADEEGNGEEQCTVADPVSIGIGNSFQQDTDYRQSGLSLLEFVRSYNALGSKSRLLRNYWTSTFDRQVLRPTVAGEPTRVRRPDGRVIPFDLIGGEYHAARPYFHSTLVAYGDGWQFITEDDIKETYDAAGRWIRIEDANGRLLTASYMKELLTKVEANTGESLALSYNSYQQLTGLKDHSGRTWEYRYNGYANLIQVRKPDGIFHTYHYESEHDPHLLTGISIGINETPTSLDRYVTWEYDDRGRVVSNHLTDGLKRYDFFYNDVTGERVVRDALGNESVYQASIINGRGFVDGVIGPGFASCGLADMQLERDADQNVISRTVFGRTTLYGDYDSKGQYGFAMEAAGTPVSRLIEYTYDPRFTGKPVTITGPSVAPGKARTTRIDYDERGNIVRRVVEGFRPDGLPVTRSVAMEYAGPLGQITAFDGPRDDVSDVIRFHYDTGTGRLARVVDANGIVIRDNITYTPTGQIASEDRPSGSRVLYRYYPGNDLLESVAETGQGLTRVTSWTYDARERVDSIIVSDGVNADQVTLFDYNAAGDLLSVSSPGAGIIRYAYDNAGNRIEDRYTTGQYGVADTRWIKRTFDAYGRVEALINPYSTVTTAMHPEGTPTSTTDGEGNTTEYQYDDLRRLTQILQPGQVATRFAHDVADRVVQVTAANEASTRMIFDDLGNQILHESPDAGTSSFTHDRAGNLIQATNAMGEVASHAYDAGGRLLQIDRIGAADDETYAYDGCVNGVGRVCSIVNGIGEVVSYEYDAFGRIAKQTTNAGEVAYAYDAADNVVSISYPSKRIVHFAYNAAGQTTDIAVTDGGSRYVLVRDVAYVPFGPAKQWAYGNGLTEIRQYDQQYRPNSFDVSGRSKVTFSQYDGNGNPLQRDVNGDVQSFGYDTTGRLMTAAGQFGTRAYDYDAVGNRVALATGDETTVYSYQPGSNRLVADSHWTYALDANGSEIERRADDGSGWELVHTAKNRLLGVIDLQNPEATVGGYRYNALGQRTIKSTSRGDTLFIYGQTGELLAELLPGGSVVQEYVYLNGAPIALLGPPASPSATVEVDQIIDNLTDANTCTSTRSKKAVNDEFAACSMNYNKTYKWPWTPPVGGDYDVYVNWAWTSPSQCYRFADGLTCTGEGARAGTWLSLGRHHLGAGTPSPVLKVDDNHYRGLDSVKMDAARFVLRQADIADRDYSYVHSDALGTPLRVSDRDGRIVWSARYDPFGEAVVDNDPDGDGAQTTLNLRFPGQYFDAETGLHYNYYRDYSPALGRYLQSDPIGLAGGINTYAYVGGNPVSFVDPLGLRVRPPPHRNTSPNPNQLRLPLTFAPGPQPAPPRIVLNRTHQRWEYHTATVRNAMWREGHKWWPASDYDDMQGEQPCAVMVCGPGIDSNASQSCPNPETEPKQQMTGPDGLHGCRCL